MLGSAVSSSTPRDFQPNSHKGVLAFPQMIRHALAAPPGNAYVAVGMTRALDSAIGLPSRSTSALWMLVFLMPAEVSSNFMMSLLAGFMEAERLRQSRCSKLRPNHSGVYRLISGRNNCGGKEPYSTEPTSHAAPTRGAPRWSS